MVVDAISKKVTLPLIEFVRINIEAVAGNGPTRCKNTSSLLDALIMPVYHDIKPEILEFEYTESFIVDATIYVPSDRCCEADVIRVNDGDSAADTVNVICDRPCAVVA